MPQKRKKITLGVKRAVAWVQRHPNKTPPGLTVNPKSLQDAVAIGFLDPVGIGYMLTDEGLHFYKTKIAPQEAK